MIAIIASSLAFALGAVAHRAVLLILIRRWERDAPTDELKRERKWVAILFRYHVMGCCKWD